MNLTQSSMEPPNPNPRVFGPSPKHFHWPHFVCTEKGCDFHTYAEWSARSHEYATGHEVRVP